MWSEGETRVFAASGVDLRLGDGGWGFADRHRNDIAAHWSRRTRETPDFFDGTVHLLTSYTVSGSGILSARFVRTDFKNFLFWRETGWPDRGVMDGFGSALIVSAEGHVLLGRQRAGNLNSGLCYPPGGFIDARDVGPDGTIDIDASVAREIGEETGLRAPEIQRAAGYLVTIAGPVLSIAVLYRSALPGPALLSAVRGHIAADARSELADVVLVVPGEASHELPMPAYARALLAHLPRLKSPG